MYMCSVYVCVKAKLTLVFFAPFPLDGCGKQEILFCVWMVNIDMYIYVQCLCVQFYKPGFNKRGTATSELPVNQS